MPRNPKSNKKNKAKSNDAPLGAELLETPSSNGGPRPEVWRPGVDAIAEGEELQFDPSAYNCLHSFRISWPCLSFDIVRDVLGEQRTAFPHTVFLVAGTQADVAGNNAVAAVRLSNLRGMKHKERNVGEDGEEESSDSDSDEEDEEGDISMQTAASTSGSTHPAMQARLVAHHGGVNRIRAMAQQPHICATWGETGHVQIWDLGAQMRGVASESGAVTISTPVRQPPLHIFAGHSTEGFAMDWSPVVVGQLATGDCAGAIHLWEPAEGGKWVVNSRAFGKLDKSVEDLQWSPTEGTVFASAGVDGNVRIWDTRAPGQAQAAITVHAHTTDVNVISWSRLSSCMLASGADDGSFRIWDLRSFQDDSFVAHFKYHGDAVTSIEWSPHDSSTIGTTSADNQLIIWDLSLERDPEEEREFEAELGKVQAQVPSDIPPQLLFIHQGQKELKEFHWHSQIPGLILSTAGDGFNAFMPSNL